MYSSLRLLTPEAERHLHHDRNYPLAQDQPRQDDHVPAVPRLHPGNFRAEGAKALLCKPQGSLKEDCQRELHAPLGQDRDQGSWRGQVKYRHEQRQEPELHVLAAGGVPAPDRVQ